MLYVYLNEGEVSLGTLGAGAAAVARARDEDLWVSLGRQWRDWLFCVRSLISKYYKVSL